jgi:hypothetical protein
MFAATNKLLNTAGVEILPQIGVVLAQIEAKLTEEDISVIERIQPIINEARDLSNNPVNTFGYADLSGKLTALVGQLSVRIIITPRVFVGHRYTPEDEKVTTKFMELFRLEELDHISGKSAKPMDMDDKVKAIINESDVVIRFCQLCGT